LFNNFGYNFLEEHWCKEAYAYFKYNGSWHGLEDTRAETLAMIDIKGNLVCPVDEKNQCLNVIPTNRKMIESNINRFPKKTIKCDVKKSESLCRKIYNYFFNGIFHSIKGYFIKQSKKKEKHFKKIISKKLESAFNQDYYDKNKNLRVPKIKAKKKTIFRLKFGTEKWDKMMKKKFGENYKNIYMMKYGNNWKEVVRQWWNRKHRVSKTVFSLKYGSKAWNNYMKTKFGVDWRNVFLIKFGNKWRNYLRKWWKLKKKSIK
jgi:hypothetical protein